MEWTRIMLGWKQRLHIVLMSRVAFKKPICLPVWILWGVSEVHTQEQSTSFIQPVNSKYLHQYQAKRKEALCKSYSVEISICVVYLGVTVTLLSCKWNKLTGALSQCLGSQHASLSYWNLVSYFRLFFITTYDFFFFFYDCRLNRWPLHSQKKSLLIFRSRHVQTKSFARHQP